jgi:hypothetical protein
MIFLTSDNLQNGCNNNSFIIRNVIVYYDKYFLQISVKTLFNPLFQILEYILKSLQFQLNQST